MRIQEIHSRCDINSTISQWLKWPLASEMWYTSSTSLVPKMLLIQGLLRSNPSQVPMNYLKIKGFKFKLEGVTHYMHDLSSCKPNLEISLPKRVLHAQPKPCIPQLNSECVEVIDITKANK